MIPPAFIAGIGEAAAKLVKNVIGGNGLDGLFTSKEEKLAKANELAKIEAEMTAAVQAQMLEFAKLNLEEAKAYMADTQDARANNSRIQESEKASWLAKNVAYMIDLFLTVLWGGVTIILFLKIFKVAAQEVDMISLMALHGTVTAVFMTVLNFHRGTSKGSEDKSKQLNIAYNKKDDISAWSKEQLEEALKKKAS